MHGENRGARSSWQADADPITHHGPRAHRVIWKADEHRRDPRRERMRPPARGVTMRAHSHAPTSALLRPACDDAPHHDDDRAGAVGPWPAAAHQR